MKKILLILTIVFYSLLSQSQFMSLFSVGYPNCRITLANTSICSGASATLTSTGNCLNYTWSSGQSTSAITVSPTATTTYTITAYSAKCFQTVTAQAVISVTTTPTITVNDATINTGESATLTASGGTNYSWSTGASTSAISVSPTVTTTYLVSAIGTCVGTAISTVTVVAPFDPEDLPSLIGIYNPSVNLTKDVYDAVSSWADQSNSNAFTQSTTGNKPSYIANQINGKPVVRFVSPTYLSSSVTQDGDITIYIVMKGSVASWGQAINFDATEQMGIAYWDGSNLLYGDASYDYEFVATTGANYFQTTWVITKSSGHWLINVNHVNKLDKVKFYRDILNMEMGRMKYSGTYYYFRGDIAYFALYGAVHSAANIEKMEHYINEQFFP